VPKGREKFDFNCDSVAGPFESKGNDFDSPPELFRLNMSKHTFSLSFWSWRMRTATDPRGDGKFILEQHRVRTGIIEFMKPDKALRRY
jgi:hypothetical protein